MSKEIDMTKKIKGIHIDYDFDTVVFRDICKINQEQKVRYILKTFLNAPDGNILSEQNDFENLLKKWRTKKHLSWFYPNKNLYYARHISFIEKFFGRFSFSTFSFKKRIQHYFNKRKQEKNFRKKINLYNSCQEECIAKILNNKKIFEYFSQSCLDQLAPSYYSINDNFEIYRKHCCPISQQEFLDNEKIFNTILYNDYKKSYFYFAPLKKQCSQLQTLQIILYWMALGCVENKLPDEYYELYKKKYVINKKIKKILNQIFLEFKEV